MCYVKVIQINTVYNQGSTGKIAIDIQEFCYTNDIKNIVAYRYAEKNKKYSDTYEISSWLDCHIHNRLSSITWLQGHFSKLKTKKFIKYINEYKPNIVHLHNIHGSYLNFKTLFNYIKKHNIKVIWTLHDCWSFTGHCPHFDMVKCEKWKERCYDCPQFNDYPSSKIDNSEFMYKLKKQCFTGVKDLTIVTPSKWLSELVKQSFLKDYPVKVINNGINLDIFKPTKSDFRKNYNCGDKIILLGVAFGWGKRKGLDVFIELSKRLNNKYQIVLVGTDENVDKLLPKNIISIHRTQNQQELAQIYSASNIFINPTREENFPTVNMESIACGTPVITFNTGGSPEIIDETCGIVVEKDDIESMIKAIYKLAEDKIDLQLCIKRAKMFDKNEKYQEYINLYKNI